MINYEKLTRLSGKIKDGTANKEERDDYMWILYQNGSITKNQYDNYKSEKNTSEILNAGLTIGAFILLGALINKIAKSY